MFGVKRITCFCLDFSKCISEPGNSKVLESKEKIESLLKGYESNPTETPDLGKFRYADDSMFVN
jgi:hypothetical protein